MGIFATGRAAQLEHFADADRRHFAWQTEGGYFAATERALVELAELPTGGRLLEVGCGEGGNLYHLGARAGFSGVDFAHAKLRHARTALPAVGFARADAAALPWGDAVFDAVLIRDVLHHVPDRAAVLREAARVLRLGGVLGVIEPNAGSPLILAQAALVKAERAVLRSHAGRLARELAGVGLVDVSVARAQPLPLARVVLHPALGLAGLGRRPAVARLLGAADAMARRLVPPVAWMYLVARARRPAP